MKEPIIVYENGDISIFESIERAERYLEPIDIQNQEYRIFDSDGYEVKPKVVKNDNGIEIVKFQFTDKICHLSEMRNYLIEFLLAIGESAEEIFSLSNQQIVEKALRYKSE